MLSRPLALVLVGSAVLLLAALRHPPPLTIEVGSPGDERFVRGFHAAVGTDRAFRWSGPEAVLVLHGAFAGPHRLAFRVDGGPSSRARTISIGVPARHEGPGLVLAAFDAGPGWSVHEVDVSLPAVLWPPAGPVVLTLTTAPYRRGEDGALLGVKVDEVRIERADAGWLPPLGALTRAATSTWALAIAGVLLTRLGGFLMPARPEGSRQIGAAVLTGLAGVVLAWSSARDPYRTAWLLPSIPILLVLATLGLWWTRDAREMVAGRASPARRPWRGWVILVASLVLFWLQAGTIVAFALAILGVACLARDRSWRLAAPDALPERVGTRRGVRWALGAIFLLAVGMRLYGIERLPYGMWRDEARIGLVGLRMIADPGYRPAYVSEVTLPGGGLYLLSLGIRACGITPWSMRLVTALGGALTVFPLFGVVRRVTGRADVALFGCGLLAASSWHVTVSRLSYPTALHPLFEIAALWCLMAALAAGLETPPRAAGRRFLLLAGAGALLGLAVQTYHTGRVSLLVAALLVLVTWRTRRARPLDAIPLVVLAVAFLAVAAPLLAVAWRHAGEVNERLRQIFIFSEAEKNAIAPLAALDASVGRHLLMLNVRGDVNGRRNVPRRPMVDPLTGVGIVAGLVALWLAPRRGCAAPFLSGALVLELLPSLLAVEGPHAQRSLGAVPYACAVAAVGWVALAEGVKRRTCRVALLVSAAVLAVVMNAWTYFGVMSTDERSWGAFYTVPTQVGRYLRETAGPAPTAAPAYVDASLRGSVLEYLSSGIPVGTFDGESLAPPPSGPARLVLPGPLDADRIVQLGARLGLSPEPETVGPPLPDGRTPSFVVYRVRGPG